MKFIFLGAGLVVLLAVLGDLYIRLTPVGPEDVPPVDRSRAPGAYPMEGGFYVVRPAADVDLTGLEKSIADTPRTKKLSGSAANPPMVFVHRSLIWGFPDVTQVWVEGANVHIYSHLVYGGSDLGVNRKRMDGWLGQ
ncbi:uncharacterized protein DUF1499 [Roseibium hamelinense]|uniref:Uncharacterized protein DUF1499 n=1 Tax=Roseibium hamelinense TaxID=150831 RepID=A0A562T7N4_9HYPH|nr:DUF1499 domain-containing protein [Roseibium hamelinense]MTI43004.1 DUF1499 domain-containing protein [Roseibium hamelinense]TWI89615.1 uncharacterized protein DUF1499 [Roseibium hamelinense]